MCVDISVFTCTVLATPIYITVIIRSLLFNTPLIFYLNPIVQPVTLYALRNHSPTRNPVFLSDSHMKSKTVELTETESVHLL